jgi:hypothetical protein
MQNILCAALLMKAKIEVGMIRTVPCAYLTGGVVLYIAIHLMNDMHL